MNPSRIRILAVGKLRKSWVLEGASTFLKRLPGLQVLELRDAGMAKESEAILAALKPDERLVILTEEGQTLDSVSLAQRLEGSGSERLAFVIGGAEGIDPALKARASWRLSLSPMTLKWAFQFLNLPLYSSDCDSEAAFPFFSSLSFGVSLSTA